MDPKVPQSNQKYLKVPKSASKYPKIPQSTQKYPNVPKSTSQYPKVPLVWSGLVHPLHCGSVVVVKTFEILTAERVPSDCNQSRYIADIFLKDIFIVISDILPIYWQYTADIHINLRCSTALLQVVQSIALSFGKEEQNNLIKDDRS